MARGGHDQDDRDELRALIAGPKESCKRMSKIVRRKGILVNEATSFDDALSLASRHNFSVALLDMGEGEFKEPSWVELLESLGVEVRLFCLVPDDLDEELKERLDESGAALLPKPLDENELSKRLGQIVKESSGSLNIPKAKSRGTLRMRDYDDE